MPAELQIAIELTLTNWENIFAYADDILYEEVKKEHRKQLHKVLTKLRGENLAF